MPVTVFSKVPCGGCQIVKKMLETNGVEYIERRIDLDESALKEVQSLGLMGVPVVVAEGVEPFAGVNMSALEQVYKLHNKK